MLLLVHVSKVIAGEGIGALLNKVIAGEGIGPPFLHAHCGEGMLIHASKRLTNLQSKKLKQQTNKQNIEPTL